MVGFSDEVLGGVVFRRVGSFVLTGVVEEFIFPDIVLVAILELDLVDEAVSGIAAVDKGLGGEFGVLDFAHGDLLVRAEEEVSIA